MRLTADAAAHERCRLLFAVYPVFISAVQCINSEYQDSVTIMRTEIKKMIPMMFREKHLEYDLSTAAFQECKDQLESILCRFEGLVDEQVCNEDGTSREHDTVDDQCYLLPVHSDLTTFRNWTNYFPGSWH
jgi:hypothetical protein